MKTLREVGQVVCCDGAASTSLRDIAYRVDPNLSNPVSARNVLERGSTAKYTFTLEQFRITNTRARHNDTDYVCFGLKIGDNNFTPKTLPMGDLNNGTYHVGLDFGPVPIDGPDTPIIFNYQIVNNGHSSTESTIEALVQNSKTLAAQYASEGNVWGLVAEGALTLVGWFFADCDGAVAVDQVAVKESVLKGWTCASGSYTPAERYYPGYDSPTGCGSNSEYYVTWSINRSF